MNHWLGRTSVSKAQARLFHFDCLLKLTCQRVKDQDFIVFGHNRIPAVATGESGGFAAVGQFNAFGHFGSSTIETGDKQADHDYKPANHHYGQHSDQLAQKAQVGWFYWFRSLCHVFGSFHISDRGHAACAS